MEMKRNKLTIKLILSLFAVIILSSCGEKTTDEEASEVSSIQIWTNMETELELLKEYGAKWEEETGNKVEILDIATDIQKFAQASKSKNGPDGIFGLPNDQLANYIEAGLVEEVPESVFENSEYVESSVQSIYFDGKRYAVPIAVETNALFYNTEKINSAPKTFDELVNLAETNGGFQFEATSIYYDLGFLRAFGGYIFSYNDGEYDVNDIGLGTRESVEAYDYINMLANEYGFFSSDITNDVARGNFQSGETAFYIGGPWDISGFESAGVPFSVAAMPTLNNQSFITPVGTQVGFVSSESLNKQVVWEFYSYLLENMSVDLYNIGGRIPAKITAQNEIQKNPYTDAFLDQIRVGEPLPTVSELGQVWTPFTDNIKLMIQGTTTPDEAAKIIEEQVVEGINMMNEGR